MLDNAISDRSVKWTPAKKRLVIRWGMYQAENEERFQRPHIDLGSVCLALGAILYLIWALVWLQDRWW